MPAAFFLAPVEGGTASVALDVHLKDGSVVDEAVDGSHRRGFVREHLIPVAEGLVSRDQQGALSLSVEFGPPRIALYQ